MIFQLFFLSTDHILYGYVKMSSLASCNKFYFWMATFWSGSWTAFVQISQKVQLPASPTITSHFKTGPVYQANVSEIPMDHQISLDFDCCYFLQLCHSSMSYIKSFINHEKIDFPASNRTLFSDSASHLFRRLIVHPFSVWQSAQPQ